MCQNLLGTYSSEKKQITKVKREKKIQNKNKTKQKNKQFWHAYDKIM